MTQPGVEGDFRLTELTLALYAPSLLVAVGQQALLIMLPLYALELGGGPAAAATFLGLKGLGRMLSALPSGTAISRLGDKRTMMGGLALMTAVTLLLAFTDDLLWVSVLALAFGAAMGAWMLARLHYVAEHCPISHRGRAMTVLAGVQRLGTFIGPALGGITVKFFGYPTLFLGAAVFTLAGLLLVALFTKPTAPESLATHPPLSTLARVIVDHQRVFSRAGTSTIALQFVRSGRQLLLPLWGEAIGLDPAEIGLVFSLSSAIDVCMFYPAGHIMDFWGRKWALASTLITLGLTLALLSFTTEFWGYLAVALLSGVGNGLGTGVVMTLGADLSPVKHRGEFLGVWRLIGDLGSAVGPFVIGAGAEVLTLTGALMLNLAIAGIGGLIVIVAVEETMRRR